VAEFTRNNPRDAYSTETARWQAFRDTPGYKAARDALEQTQHRLCAYCEIALSPNNRQIEHIQPKSRTADGHDHTLEFSNYLLCCKGGTHRHGSVSAGEFSDNSSIKRDLSCGQKKAATNPDGVCLNPYALPDFPVFTIIPTSEGIEFGVDASACARAGIDPGLVEKTLEVLGLNCPRLCKRRQAVWDELKKEISSADNVLAELQDIADSHLKPPTAFYTLKLLVLTPYLA
jgi:uncharacterized protein (TIGR02646 family)